jgi:MarR family transcriptional regulator, lower aerobic nicotinate degradation pathway regulator
MINRKIGQGMPTNHPLADLYGRPGFLLKRSHQVAAAIFLDECGEYNITPSQHGCLHALHEFPGIDQIALGRLVGLDRSTAGLVIKALSKRKLIDRVVNRYDKRRMRLKLSADGEHLLRTMEPAAARARDRVFRGLPRESRAAFADLLRAFLAGHDALINVDEVLAGSMSNPDLAETQRPSGKRQRVGVSKS